MGKATFDISMSLDGFITGPNQTPEQPLGEGGEQHLHGWGFDPDEPNRQVALRYLESTGAYVCGRRTFDHSLPFWEERGPGGPQRPVFVVTHRSPSTDPPGGLYRFVTDGLAGALRQAHAAAGGRDVSIIGGAELGRQYLAAGLVDEVMFHLVPVLLGAGTRMFDDLGRGPRALEVVDTIATPAATHLRYRMLGQS